MWNIGFNRGCGFGNRCNAFPIMTPQNQCGWGRTGSQCGWGMQTGQCPNVMGGQWSAPTPYGAMQFPVSQGMYAAPQQGTCPINQGISAAPQGTCPMQYYDDSIAMNGNNYGSYGSCG